MLNANVTIKTNDNNNSEQIHWYDVAIVFRTVSMRQY